MRIRWRTAPSRTGGGAKLIRISLLLDGLHSMNTFLFPRSWSRAGRLGLLVFPALLTSYGCWPQPPSGGEEDALPDQEASVQDSAGILIVETPEEIATAPLGWKIDSVPLLALGSEENESEVFFGVRGLRALPGGGVLVLDGGSRELRFFDSLGQLTHRVGRKGEGPGEFDRPYLVQTANSDSLLVWDGALKRFQVFTGSGEYARMIRLNQRWPMGGNPPMGAIDSLTLLRVSESPFDPQRRPGPVEETTRVFWYHPSTGVEVPITAIKALDGVMLVRPGYREAGFYGIPFTTRPTATVNQSSALFIDGVSPEIREYGVDGFLRRIFRVPGFRRPVNRAIEEENITYSLTRIARTTRAELERLFDELPSPDTLPAFQSLQVDEVGWTWAEVYHWDRTIQSGRWMVFDPEGRAHGIIQTPDGLQIQRIGEDFLLGVRSDELGVERVFRYRLMRNLILAPRNRPDP